MNLPAGTVKRIHVNRVVISQNLRDGTARPPLTIQTSKGARQARKVVIHGPSFMVYSPDKPLRSGARVWVETTAEVSYSL